MLARLATAALVGLTAYPVGVEVDIGRGLPAVMVVGLGDAAVLEARDRLRAAFGNAGFEWPDRRVTISLPPSDLPKQGSGFDLPIAIGLLAATGAVPQAAVDGLWAVGELGLGGDVRGVRGVLASAIAARDGGARLLLVPAANLAEAALVPGLRVGGASSLAQVDAFLRGEAGLDPPSPCLAAASAPVEDLADVRGQPLARRALEIAAAGGHNLLLVGPPGAGKTMLARRLRGLLPELDRDEALEVTQVLSAAGLVHPGTPLASARPFRAPHHGISMAGMVGGGPRVPRPGEVSLAHRGVLFLDELAEFPRPVCEALRQPLEDGEVTVVRSAASVRFPARFSLVAAANPCPCGHLGDAVLACRCGSEGTWTGSPPTSSASPPAVSPPPRSAPGSTPPGRCSRRAPAARTPACRSPASPGCAPRPPPRGGCWPSPSTGSASPPAASTAPSASPARSPTSPVPTGSPTTTCARP